MDDSIDWQCYSNTMKQLATCTFANGYNTDIQTVLLAKSKTVFKGYPLIIVIPGQINPLQEFLKREDVLPVSLIYTDGILEDDISYIQRYKNVHADIIKCLKANKTLDNVCQNVVIPSYGYMTIAHSDAIQEDICYWYVEIERTIDTDNPYNKA